MFLHLGVAWADARSPDRIVLEDGFTAMGKVTGTRASEISIDTDFAGALTIGLEKVASCWWSIRNPGNWAATEHARFNDLDQICSPRPG